MKAAMSSDDLYKGLEESVKILLPIIFLVGLFAVSHVLRSDLRSECLIYHSFLEVDSSTYFSKTFFFLEGVNISSCRHNWFIKMTARKK